MLIMFLYRFYWVLLCLFLFLPVQRGGERTRDFFTFPVRTFEQMGLGFEDDWCGGCAYSRKEQPALSSLLTYDVIVHSSRMGQSSS